jgi:hypothetical protein
MRSVGIKLLGRRITDDEGGNACGQVVRSHGISTPRQSGA